MAFPSTISTLVEPYHGLGGPFVSSAGYVYVVTRASTTNSIQVFKAADPSGSWAGASTLAVTSGNTIRAIGAYQVADILHIVTRDAAAANSNVIRYHTFNMATDAFVTSNQLVKTTYTQKGAVDDSMVSIIIRGDGTKIIMYEGPQVLADVQRARTYYARYMGAAWSADIAVDNGGNIDWYPQEAILGGADRTHFIFMDAPSNGSLYQRTLTSANALEVFPAAFDGTIAGYIDTGHNRGAAYSTTAGVVVRIPYYYNTTPTIQDINFISDDAPTPLIYAVDITGAVDPTTNPRRAISYAADEHTVYAVFAGGDGDLYLMSNTDDAGWTTATSILAGTTSSIWTNIYVRNSARVIAIVYNEDPTNLTYTEHTLSAAAVVNVGMFRMSLLGVGR